MKYEVTTNVKSLGLNVTEIEADSLRDAQTKALEGWKIKITQLQPKADFSLSFDETIRAMRMTMLGKWEITIVEK